MHTCVTHIIKLVNSNPSCCRIFFIAVEVEARNVGVSK